MSHIQSGSISLENFNFLCKQPTLIILKMVSWGYDPSSLLSTELHE